MRAYVMMSALGHSRLMHSIAVPINVRCYSNSDIIVWRSKVTLKANSGIQDGCTARSKYVVAFARAS